MDIACTLNGLDELLQSADSILMNNAVMAQRKVDLEERVRDMESEISAIAKQLENLTGAAYVLGKVSDEAVSTVLNNISGVINKALDILFDEDKRYVRIVPSMFKKKYPHFSIEVYDRKGTVRSFRMSGKGLSEVVSLLYTVCLIDVRGGRKFLAIDEFLAGLHPMAKKFISNLLVSLAHRFQFIMVEYHLDIGRQYVLNKQGEASRLALTRSYYAQLYRKMAEGVETEDDSLDSLA